MPEKQADVATEGPSGIDPVRSSGEPDIPPSRHRWMILSVVCVTVLIVNLDNTVVNVALPTLVRDLNASSSDLEWIVDAYIIVFAGLLLAAGSLADRVGRKKTFLAGLVIFAACSGWAAFSGSVNMLVTARVCMAVGGALMIPSTLAIISNMFRDPAERQRAIAIWAGTTGLGVALGPIIGGLLLSHFWWGSIFLINVPIAAVSLLAAIRLIPDSRNPAALAPDLTGAAASIAGIGLILWAIIEGPVRGWTSGLVIGVGVDGLVIMGIFFAWERVCSHPMLNLRFFRQRSFSAAIPAVATVSFGLYGALFVLTQYLQFSLGFSPMETGVRLIPAAGTLLLTAPFSAVLIRFLGSKITMGVGLALIAAGLWQVSSVTTATTFGGTVLGMILLGAGAGLALPTATGSVIASVPAGETGVASATSSTAAQLGGGLGVAIVGSILSTRYQGKVPTVVSGEHIPTGIMDIIRSSLGGAIAVADMAAAPTGDLLAGAARAAFVNGMALATLTAAFVTLAGCLLALAWFPSRPPTSPEDAAG